MGETNPIEPKKNWQTFTSFSGLFEFVGHYDFDIILVFEDDLELKSQSNYLIFPVDLIDVNTYNWSDYSNSTRIGCREYDFSYVSSKLEKLRKVPNFTYKDLK